MAVTVIGCQDSASTKPQADTVAVAEDPNAAAKRRFKNFVDDFTRWVANDTARTGDVEYEYSVSQELIPPSSADEPYRAKVTVSKRSTVTVLILPQDDEEDQERDTASTGDLTEDEVSGVDSGDMELPAGRPGVDLQAHRDPIKELHQDEMDVYELVYENDRWVAVSEPQPPDSFIAKAYHRALNRQ